VELKQNSLKHHVFTTTFLALNRMLVDVALQISIILNQSLVQFTNPSDSVGHKQYLN